MAFEDLLPGLLSAGASIYASNQAADAAAAAGQQAAQAAQFRPVGITTRFGRTGFQYDPSGRLAAAGYQVAPDVAAMREAGIGLAGGALQQALDAQQAQSVINQAGAGLFNLGQQYIAQSPRDAALQYMAQQADLLAPLDERNFAALQNRMYRTGTTGLALGATGARPSGAEGLAAANPQVEAYYNALNQRNAQLAAQAMTEGQKQATFGQGLLGGALNLIGGGYGLQQQAYTPASTGLTFASDIEKLGGQEPIRLSSGLGAGSGAAAQAMLSGADSARLLDMQRNAVVMNTLSDPISQLISSLSRTSLPTGVSGGIY